jgi:uncharacterized protein (DUF1778 family)
MRRRRHRIDFHVHPHERYNIYLAAETRGQSVSEYVREACAQAIEVDIQLLLEKRTTAELPHFKEGG